MTMQLGFVSAILPDRSLDQVVSFAAGAGYDCVELCCWPPSKAERRYAGVTHVDVSEFDDAAAKSVLETVRSPVSPSADWGITPTRCRLTQQSRRSPSSTSARSSSPRRRSVWPMNTFVGRDWTKSVEDNWPRFLETWRPLIAFAEEHDVRVGIENCPMLFSADEWPGGKNLATTPTIWRRMFGGHSQRPLRAELRPVAHVWQHMDYLAPMREFAGKLFHVHAKDVRLDRDRLDQVGILAHPLEYHTPKLPGMGEVDWGRFFSTLTDTGYAGPVCVEVEDRAYEDHSPRARRRWCRVTHI